MLRSLAFVLLGTLVAGCAVEGPFSTIRQLNPSDRADERIQVILAKQWTRYSWWLWGDQEHERHEYYLARLDLAHQSPVLSDVKFIGKDAWQQQTRFYSAADDWSKLIRVQEKQNCEISVGPWDGRRRVVATIN